ncbi:MAG: site-2 protease family protein [Acholeplasmataceae bacterium]|jgi:hypothetical protein
MKAIRKIKYILLILIAIMIGVAVAAITHNHDVKSPWWGHLLVVIGSIFLTLTIHELAHAFTFSIQKIKIKAVYLFMFMFIRKGRIFTLKINPKLLLLGGGLVVPLMPPVTNDQELEDIGKKLAKALIAAPITSIVFGFLTFIIFMIILLFSNNFTFISLMITATIVILLLTVLVIVASSASNEQAAGDFVAFQKVKNDRDYLIQIISSYIVFNPEAEVLSKDYLLNKKIDYMLDKGLSYNLITYSYLIDYLEGVIFENKLRNESLDNQIFCLNKNILSRSNEGISVLFLISYLHYLSGDDDKTFELLDYIKNIKHPKVSQKYLEHELKRAYHLLNISDETEFLKSYHDIELGLNWIFAPLFDNKDGNLLNIKLKKGIKIPKINFYNKL